MFSSENRQEWFANARNFAVYYGHGQASALSAYDIAIVETAGQTADTLEQLREASTLALAYVSITEVPDYDPLGKLLRETDYLRLNGKVVENEEYHTKVADLKSKNWINLLLHRIGGFIRKAKYDGLFLDTISNVEWPILPPGVRAEQQNAAVELLQRIRRLYPGQIIVQNNGLETLCVDTAPYIDGLCWENPDFVRPETYKWHEKVRLRLKRLQAEHRHLKIMLLLEKGSTTDPAYESALYWSRREKYLIYLSTNRYLEMRSSNSAEGEEEE